MIIHADGEGGGRMNYVLLVQYCADRTQLVSSNTLMNPTEGRLTGADLPAVHAAGSHAAAGSA